MANNKVIYNGNTLIDLTADTVAEDTLLEGVTAHNKAGTKITGKLAKQTKTVTVAANGTTTVKPDSGKVLSQVTITTDVPNEPNADTVDGLHVAIRSDGTAPPSGTTNTISFVYNG